jgi:hypothetical protein
VSENAEPGEWTVSLTCLCGGMKGVTCSTFSFSLISLFHTGLPDLRLSIRIGKSVAVARWYSGSRWFSEPNALARSRIIPSFLIASVFHEL